MQPLRQWQSQCIAKAKQKFELPQTHFLCLATPGAGKTIMASELSRALLEAKKIDFVIVFSPSITVADDFRSTLEKITRRSFDGTLGASGISVTYQSMHSLPDSIWKLFSSFRVFAIFDEIHHCAGDTVINANAWGEHIISKIQGKATYTLALSGTPWRSDNLPIALANYCDESGEIHVDYRYGLTNAINDKVCKRPKIKAIDNHKITLKQCRNTQVYASFAQLLEETDCRYIDIITHPQIIKALLKRSCQQLNMVRKVFPDRAGLIVAASIDHAKQIEASLNELNERAVVVTYRENAPVEKIRTFKDSQDKWIISVGMISEGTNIPRLSVCCYLSLIKTELYFRQVLGRVLRQTNIDEEVGYLFMLAHPKLIEFAQRVSVDIPSMQRVPQNVEHENRQDTLESLVLSTELNDNPIELSLATAHSVRDRATDEIPSNDPLGDWYDSMIDSLGRFKEQVFAL